MAFAFGEKANRGGTFLRLGAGWLVACIIAVMVLWGAYGFRFDAMAGAPLDVASMLRETGTTRTLLGQTASFLAAHRLLPQAWVFGLVYAIHSTSHTTYLFGREMAQSPWYYFPIALSIKTPLTVLLLCAAGLVLPGSWKGRARQCIFLAVPILVFLGAAMVSGIGLGLRHVLPLYPFLIVFAAATAAAMCERFRWGAAACGLLLVLGGISYARSFPNELAYSNEAWGGPSHLRFYLSDSNLDWSQNLYLVKDWVRQHGGQPCWIAWFGMQKPESVGIPCQTLAGPSYLESDDVTLAPPIPERFAGTVLISSGLLDYALYPYGWFRTRPPDEVIGGSVLVFHGDFDRPEVAAERRMSRGWWLMRHQRPAAAGEELAAAAAHANQRPILNWLTGWAADEIGKGRR